MNSILLDALAVLILVILSLELSARVLDFIRNRRLRFFMIDPKEKVLFFKPHPYCLYVKNENMSWPYPSNELGYVGKLPITLKKSSLRKRLYFVGGSTTEEAEELYGPESHWPGQLTEMLNQQKATEQFECINAGSAGYTTAESLAEFTFRGIDLQPDYLIIYHNVNDAWTVQMLESFSPDYSAARLPGLLRRHWLSALPQVPISFLYQMLRRRLISEFTHRGLINYISNPPWKTISLFDESRVAPFRRNLVSLVNLSRSCNCVPILVNWEHCQSTIFNTGHYLTEAIDYNSTYQRYILENNRVVWEVAKSLDVLYANVGPFDEEYFQRDGMHFNQKGRTEFAMKLSNFLFDKVN